MLRARATETLARGETSAVRAYVAFMMAFIGRGLAAASRVDPVAREELAALPEGFVFEMGVMPDGPAVRARMVDRALVTCPAGGERPDLAIRFKHLRHALVSFTFQESTARSFADDRMLVDGDVAAAMRLQRVLDRLLFLTLPHPIAVKALKRVPAIPTRSKMAASARLLSAMARPTP